MMKRTAMMLTLAFFAGTAFANSCPKEMRAIDAALPNAKLNASQMSEVKKLRADGEKFHKEGKHDQSMAALGKAKGILGIK